MLDYVMDDARLVATSTRFVRPPGTPIDEERQVVLAQPFFSHFVHRALAAAGRQDAIVRNIRARWLPMLAAGGTDTFWEHWHGRGQPLPRLVGDAGRSTSRARCWA